MHAVIDTPEARHSLSEEAERAFARGEGIEHAYIDIRMRGQRRKAGVLGACVHVIDQHPDLHASVRGFKQLPRNKDAGEIRMPDVGLNVESSPGKPRTLHPCDKGFGTFLDEAECRLPRMLGLGGRDELIETGVFGRRDGTLLRQGWTRLQLRARGEARDYQEQQAASK